MAQDPHAPAPDQGMSNFFNDLRNVWDRYGTPILWVIVVCSFSFLAWQIYNNNRVNTQQSAWSDLASSTAPSSFEGVADDHGVPGVQQLALLTAADMYLAETHTLEPGDALDELLTKAESLYERVRAMATHDEYRLNALEGLAVVAESRRDLDEAATRNDAVIALAKTMPGFDTWVARAQARKELLPRLAEPVAFQDAPEPEPVVAAEPAEEMPIELPSLDFDDLDLAPIELPE